MGEKEIFSIYEELCGYIPLNNNSTGDNGVVTDFNNDIFKILYDYSTSKNNTTNFIEDISIYLIDYYDISDYVRNLQIRDNKYDGYGGYIPDSRKIIINSTSIKMGIDAMIYDCNLDNINKTIIFNASILLTLFHEFEHALQKKNICNISLKDIKEDNYELLLVYLSEVFFDIKVRHDVYNNIKAFFTDFGSRKHDILYDYLPDERFAFYYSHNKVNQVLSSSELDFNQTISYFDIILYNHLLSGYKMICYNQVICPNEFYFRSINKKEMWKNLPFYSKNKKELLEKATNLFDLSDRIKYGFPISMEEYLNFDEAITNKIRKLTR